MEVLTYLRDNVDQIGCVECGNCCPKCCGAFCNGKCLNHPLNPDATSTVRGINCHQPPLFMVLNLGVACEAILDRVEELTGKRPKTVVDERNGVVFIERFSLYGPDGYGPTTNEFREILRLEI